MSRRSNTNEKLAADYVASLSGLIVRNLDKREVLSVTGLSSTMLERLQGRPVGDPQRFPTPFKLTRHQVAKNYWRGFEVVDWVLRQETFKQTETDDA